MVIIVAALATIIAVWALISRPVRDKDARFDFESDPLRPPTEAVDSHSGLPALSALDPAAVGQLRDAIANAIMNTGLERAQSATDPALEYALGVGDSDIDRLLGLAIQHGGKPNESLVARYRFMADAQPDRGRPRDLATWNSVQVFRWATVLSSTARWVGVDFDEVKARPFLASEMETFFDVTPSSADVRIGMAPMLFPRPDLRERLESGADALVVTIPASQANGDPLIAELLLVEYEPAAWYPLTARVEIREEPKMPTRDPRPN
ncbi:MAG: hypothetical protein ACTS27_05010 [Phycisphaerales bacterium]